MDMVPFDDRDGFIWLDGSFIPWCDAKIHVLNHGLHYASSVFEGERSYNGKVFKLREHTERLLNSAKLLDFEIPYTVDELENATLEMLEMNGVVNGYIRPVAWLGSEHMAISGRGNSVHVAIACWEWPSYFSGTAREKGISLKTSHWRKPSPHTAPTESKAACLYAINTMAKHEAERAGYTDALMLDYRGQVAEATGANIFIVKDDILYTPIPDCFLNGITRQTVLTLAGELGIEHVETVIMFDDLEIADEVFVTGTAAEITPVGRIDQIEYDVGSVTREIRDAYEKLVGKV